MLMPLATQYDTTASIFAALSQIQAHDAIEAKHQQQTLEWIKSGAPLCRIAKPDIPNKHLVSYFVLFDEKQRKILLVDHKKAQLWLPTGGHVEVDEDPLEAVKRECFEELGIEADFYWQTPLFLTVTETVGLTVGHTDVSLWYVLKGDSQASYHYDAEEFNSIKWFTIDEIPYTQSDPHMQRFVEKLQSTVLSRP